MILADYSGSNYKGIYSPGNFVRLYYMFQSDQEHEHTFGMFVCCFVVYRERTSNVIFPAQWFITSETNYEARTHKITESVSAGGERRLYNCPQIHIPYSFSFKFLSQHLAGACGVVVGSGTMLQAGWSRVPVSMRSIFSINLILPAALWLWGSTQPLTEMSTKNFPWGGTAASA
jgi:hypothetical protein